MKVTDRVVELQSLNQETPESLSARGPPAEDPSHRLDRPAPWGNVCFLVLPCGVFKPPIVFQHSTFPVFIVCSQIGLLGSSQEQGTQLLLSLKRPSPVPQPVAFTFRSSINVQEEVHPPGL